MSFRVSLTCRGGTNDDEQSGCFPAKGILPSRKGDRTSGESARCSRPRRRKEPQEDRPYLEQGCPQTNRRSAKTTLGESPKGSRQAGQVVRVVLSQAPQPASFVTFSQVLRTGPKLRTPLERTR